MPPTDALATASRLADEVLFAHAGAVDRGTREVATNLALLADAGLYGLHAPPRLGGLGAGAGTAARVTEALAGGCLTTAFVWIQHQGVVKRLVASDGQLAAAWVPRLASGDVRAGVAVGGVRPGPEPLVARRDGHGGWTLHGTVPWVTGWGLVDVLLVAARAGADGPVLWLLVDAPPVRDAGGELASLAPTVALHRVEVVACDHASSAVASLDGHPVPAGRLVATQAHADWARADAAGLRGNGSLPLGVATRCARLAEAGAHASAAALHGDVERARQQLDAADAASLPAARADAARLAWRAAEVLLVAVGGRALGTGHDAQRLAREAMFLQVFGSRPTIREAHLRRATGGPTGAACACLPAGPEPRPV